MSNKRMICEIILFMLAAYGVISLLVDISKEIHTPTVQQVDTVKYEPFMRADTLFVYRLSPDNNEIGGVEIDTVTGIFRYSVSCRVDTIKYVPIPRAGGAE